MDNFSVLLLTIMTLGTSAQKILKRNYGDRVGAKGIYIYNTILVLVQSLLFCFGLRGNFDIAVIPYSIVFAISCAVSNVFGLLAIMAGPLAITSLLISYSMLIPTIYGLIFLHQAVNYTFYIGIILLIISVFLINYKKSKNCDEKLSVKWIIYVIIAVVGTGLCSVSQNAQQVAFSGEYKSEFMAIAFGLSAIFMGIVAILKERTEFIACIRPCVKYAGICGILNAIVNIVVMILFGRINSSLIFPINSAGGIIIVALFSVLVYKERLTKWQTIGMLLGIMSLVLLQI